MNKKVLTVIIISIFLLIYGIGSYYYFMNEDNSTTLTKIEKDWIEKNKLNLIDINVENDVPVLNYVGEGIIFDFFKDFELTTGLEFNKISTSYSEKMNADYKFLISKNITSNQIKVYEDNYVLVSLDKKTYSNLNEIKNLKIGVLNNDSSNLKKYFEGLNNEIISFDSPEKLSSEFYNDEKKSIDAVFIPTLLGLKELSSGKSNLAYFSNDYNTNYVIELGKNETLNNIIKKYYKKWSNENFESEFGKYFTNRYFDFKESDQNSIAEFKSKRYIYGFIENPPYDINIKGNLYGINKSVLDKFSDVADIEIVYKKYENYEKLLNDFENGNIDLFFNMTNKTSYDLNGFVSSNFLDNKIVVLSKQNILEKITSITSLKNKNVAVLKNSVMSKILNNTGTKVIEYSTIEKLVKSNENIIILDYNTYDYYKSLYFEKYKIELINDNENYGYTMKSVTNNSIFNEYLTFYLKTISQKLEINQGLNNVITKTNNKNLLKKSLFILGITFIFIATILITSHSNKTKQPSLSFKKTDKIRYMDMLTSLKNRNYLNDNIDKWEEGLTYPKTIAIVDLNNISYINDNYGHNAGDDEIKEAANVLIKNQVINSDIMRTNGNEFLIYLVGYKEKQIELYIKKLTKELKELKHGFGAEIGYSMIEDNIKTIDDAINEATIDVRKKKEEINDIKE